jgi:hypothetical protein
VHHVGDLRGLYGGDSRRVDAADADLRDAAGRRHVDTPLRTRGIDADCAVLVAALATANEAERPLVVDRLPLDLVAEDLRIADAVRIGVA